ncbi:MAG TPA: molybdopterin-dependent oxidoreductase [Acidimicrobiales bacterium]
MTRRVSKDLRVGWKPYGLGEQKPNHYLDMAKVAWKNKRHPIWAWRILTEGVCDGCALGVAGLHDWTIDGVHLCMTRLNLLELNTADAAPDSALAHVDDMRTLDGAGLRGLGRLAHPYRRRRGERGFRRITWDEALDAVGSAIGEAGGDRTAIYLTSRGLTNETYYVAGKAARAMGIASVDSAARVCHAPSTLGLKSTIGVAATTCSYQDVLDSDLIVLWGSNPANNQPVFMKYLHMAKKTGTKVIVVNPYLEPGLERYWVPSNVDSALWGTRICDVHVPVRPGGDVAFANAVLKRLIERDGVDQDWVEAHTEGFADLAAALGEADRSQLAAAAGLTDEQIEAFVDAYLESRSAIFVWSMGITQHRDGVSGVQAIVNVALARGNVGRDGAGLMPIRGHSGVQGGAEMGAYATALPGGVPVDADSAAALSVTWGFDVPSVPGLTAPEQVEAAASGAIDVLWLAGGNHLDVLPDPPRVAAALERVPTRIHQDVVMTSQMLLDGDDVILLPAATRYEQEDGGTETTTERRVAFSPEIMGRRIGEARSEWRIFADVARRVRPDLDGVLSWPDGFALRREVAEVVPAYAGIENLRATGDAIQWGGRHLCAGGNFPTPSGKGRFTPLVASSFDVPEGQFVVATRRGKQFNSLVYGGVDPLTGAGRRDVFIDPADAATVGVTEGDGIRLTSDTGTFDGVARFARLPTSTLQVHWPEGNVLIPAGPDHRNPGSQIPDYNAVVTAEPFELSSPSASSVTITGRVSGSREG